MTQDEAGDAVTGEADSAEDLEQAHVIGLPVTIGSIDSVAHFILSHAGKSAGQYVCVANVHMLTTAQGDFGLREIIEGAHVVTSDGMPLVWELHRQGFDLAQRVYGHGLTLELLSQAEIAGDSVYFYGGMEERKGPLEAFLKKHFPKLKAVVEAPPMLPSDPPLDQDVIQRIEQSGVKLVFVGIGCPKQERWMAKHAPHLKATLLGVGAVFDLMAGVTQEAPQWMQERGLEWAYRLGAEPRRLWKRYFKTNLLYGFYLSRDILRPSRK